MAVEEGSAFLPAFFAVPGLIREGSSQRKDLRIPRIFNE